MADDDDELSRTDALLVTMDLTSSVLTSISARRGFLRRTLSDSDLISSKTEILMQQSNSNSRGVNLLRHGISVSRDKSNEESSLMIGWSGNLETDLGTGQGNPIIMDGPEGSACRPATNSSFGKQFQKPTSREESETMLRQSLAKLVDCKEGSHRTVRLREQLSVGTAGSRMRNGLKSSLSFRHQLKTSLSLSDEELKNVELAPALSRFSRSKIAVAFSPPPPGLFRSKTTQSVMSSFHSSGDSSTRHGRFSHDDHGSLPEELARSSRLFRFLLREQLTDGLAWFCSHVPRCVMQDLAFHELSLVNIEAESATNRGDERIKQRSMKLMKKARSLLNEDSDGDDEGSKSRRIRSVNSKQSLRLTSIQLVHRLPWATIWMLMNRRRLD
jgi:hypothetical protein